VGATVIETGNRAEAFLAGGVPDLQADDGIGGGIEDAFCDEGCADGGGCCGGGESVADVAVNEGGFADSCLD
jgi:hypothetical protein